MWPPLQPGVGGRRLSSLSARVTRINDLASPAALPHAVGNTLNASNDLFATYVALNATAVRAVLDA